MLSGGERGERHKGRQARGGRLQRLQHSHLLIETGDHSLSIEWNISFNQIC